MSWGPDPLCEWAIIRAKDIPGHDRRHSAVSCAKMAAYRSICRLGCGLRGSKEAQVQSYSPGGAMYFRGEYE